MGNNSSKLPKELTQEQLEELSKNTDLQIHEISQWYQRFYEFSNGHDLDKNIFHKYFKELLPNQGNSEKFCELCFSTFDTNQNNKLDYPEILIGFTTIYKPDLDNRLTWMFRLYDQNNDGLIDQAELRTALGAILLMRYNNDDSTDQIIDKIYSTFKNDNREINLEDFVAGAKANKELRDIICPDDL